MKYVFLIIKLLTQQEIDIIMKEITIKSMSIVFLDTFLTEILQKYEFKYFIHF